MRCFLAVPLRDPALAVAQQALARLRDDVSDVRWARPETLHITAHFFGSIDDAAVARALDAAGPVAAATAPFEVVLDRLGAFPDRGWPRVLWLGSHQPSAAMTVMSDHVRTAVRGAGFETDARPFRAHCTLGRPRIPWPRPARDAWEQAVARGVTAERFTADRLVLYESVTGRGGAVYLERASMPFAATG